MTVSSSISGQSQTLFIRTFGKASVLINGEAVTWPAKSAEELLWFLHAHPAGKHRHEILSELWNLEENKASANRFRVALHRLRNTLGRADAVIETAGRYTLHADFIEASDTHALHDALSASKRAQNTRECEEVLRQVLGASEGDYLPHLQGDWVNTARTQHHTAIIEGYLMLAALHCAAHECVLSTQALLHATQQDPLIGEDHHQRLMTCLAMTRDKYAAIEHYRRYRKYLNTEIGDTPMPETEHLAEQIKQGHMTCIYYIDSKSKDKLN